jgi:uncharacterized protein YggE
MREYWKILVVLVGMILPLGAAVAQAQDRGQITVTGEGVVMAPPDLAVLTLGVTTKGSSAAQAIGDNSAAMQAVLARMQKAGIEGRDMQSQGLSLNPDWITDAAGQNPQISGYLATNTLTVQVQDLDSLGAVLDAAVQDGANTLNGLTFGLADPAPAQVKARQLAVLDAKARASAMLDAAGAKLGQIISISEAGGDYPAPMMLRAAKADMAVPIAQGEVGTTARVTIVYEILQ